MGIFRKTMSILVLVCFVLSLTAASASAGRWNGGCGNDCDDDCDWDDCDDDCDWDDCDDDCDWDDCDWGGCGFFGFDCFNFCDFDCDFFDDWYWFGCWC